MRKILFLLLAMLLGTLPTMAQANAEHVVFQLFENGEMAYRQSTGEIYVLYSSTNQWERYISAQYGRLSANQATAPDTFISPTNGFGRLWAGYRSVRNRLGWGRTSEVGFEVRIIPHGNAVYLWRTDGVIYELQPDGSFNYVFDLPDDLQTVSIYQFSVTTNDLIASNMVKIQWGMTGSRYTLIEIYDASTHELIEFFDFLPTVGELEVAIPAYVTGNVRVKIYAANLYRPPTTAISQWQRLLSREAFVTVQHDNATVTETYAAYQRFASGFMIWHGDSGHVRVFFDNGTWNLHFEEGYLDLPTNNLDQTGCSRVPVNAFAIVWGSIGDYRNLLGCPLADELGYTLTITGYGADDIYTLPDGRQLRLTGSAWAYQ